MIHVHFRAARHGELSARCSSRNGVAYRLRRNLSGCRTRPDPLRHIERGSADDRVPVGKPQFIPWAAVYDQFGQGFARVRDFRRRFLKTLLQVKSVYPDAKLELDGKGLTLFNSPTPIPSKYALADVNGPNRQEEAR